MNEETLVRLRELLELRFRYTQFAPLVTVAISDIQPNITFYEKLRIYAYRRCDDREIVAFDYYVNEWTQPIDIAFALSIKILEEMAGM